MVRPETNVTYVGTTGSTHGERNETSPAKKAKGSEMLTESKGRWAQASSDRALDGPRHSDNGTLDPELLEQPLLRVSLEHGPELDMFLEPAPFELFPE